MTAGSFDFNGRNAVNGEVSEKYSGSAELSDKGEIGVIKFTDSDMPDIELQEGTIFPTEHFSEIINAALAGKTVLKRRIYDGSGPDGVYDTVATVVSGSSDTQDGVANDLLADLSSWRVTLAYFRPGGYDGIPEYEVELRLYQNGVASDLMLDYGDFAMRARLSRLDFLPNDC